MDVLAQLIRYENDELNNEQVVALFQELVDTGLAWTLQGSYGRAAAVLIQQGYIHAAAS